MSTQALEAIEQRLFAIEQRLSNPYFTPTSNIASSDIVGIAEACSLLNLSKGTLYQKTSAREVPHFKKNGRLRFSVSDLTEYLKAGRVLTVTEQTSGIESTISKAIERRSRK